MIKLIAPFLILLAAELLYFKIAAHFRIIDKPNERSSHAVPTIRGGGIIFLLSTILFFLWNSFAYPYLLIALTASAIVSFIDDIKTVNNRLKFIVHLISILLVLKEAGIYPSLSVLFVIIVVIIAIGIINAYNFMDGVNGITGLYSLAVIVPLALTEPDSQLQVLQYYTLIGLLVFNFFNTRKKARCFAGDVGSITIAVLVVFFLTMRIKDTSNFAYIGMLLIYGIDTVNTIIQRLIQRENIFKPHRKHLYQYFCNEKNQPHIFVSTIYAVLQFFICLAIVYGFVDYLKLIVLLVLLTAIYWALKLPFIKYKMTKSPATPIN